MSEEKFAQSYELKASDSSAWIGASPPGKRMDAARSQPAGLEVWRAVRSRRDAVRPGGRIERCIEMPGIRSKFASQHGETNFSS